MLVFVVGGGGQQLFAEPLLQNSFGAMRPNHRITFHPHAKSSTNNDCLLHYLYCSYRVSVNFFELFSCIEVSDYFYISWQIKGFQCTSPSNLNLQEYSIVGNVGVPFFAFLVLK